MRRNTYRLSIIIMLLCIGFILFNISLSASMTGIELIMTNPGENTSEEMNISWQSPNNKSTLYYTMASDANFANAIIIEMDGVVGINYNSSDKYYKYAANLTDLIPNTSYIYKIVSGSTTSDVYKFKTSGIDGEFNFAIVGDIHANASEPGSLQNADNLVKKANELSKDNGGIDFVLSQGDLTKYGERYNDWEQWNNSYSLKNYMFATVPGNKEYYNTGKAISSNKWFLASTNNPDNGPDELKSCYWFMYNSVLFLCVDNIFPNFDEVGDEIKAWIKDAINTNEGKYQYIVLIKHYPDFVSANKTDYSTYQYGNYKTWYSFYDECNIDFVISGDNHEYARSNRLYNNEVYEGEDKGTYYITAPMIYESFYTPNYLSCKNCLLDVVHDGATTGACYFTVTKTEMTFNVFDLNGLHDSVTLKAKREYNYESSISLMKDSLNVFQNASKTKAVVHFNPGYTGLIKSISVILNKKTIGKYEPINDGTNEITLNDLNNNDKLTIKFTFVDDSSETLEYVINENDDYGEIYGFKCTSVSGALEFSFKADLKNDIVDSFEIYKGSTLLGKLKNSDRKLSVDKDYIYNNDYTLKALTKDGDVVFSDTCKYDNIGDINEDGKIDKEDMNEIIDKLISKDKSLNNQEANGDNEFNLIDATIINIKANGEDLSTNKVKVKFVDINGNTIEVKIINKGDDITAPSMKEVAGYQIKGWSQPLKDIQKDTSIKVVYIISD